MTVVIDARRGADSSHARGVLFVHSCPSAVAPHLEWALARVFATTVDIDWASQPVAPVAFSTIRFEVTEDPVDGREGERFAVTPNLGLFRGTIGVHGDVLVHEERLRSLMVGARAGGQEAIGEVLEEIDRLIGTPWDEELEAFRMAHEGATVRVLHEVV
jgi:hypothetical protein